MSFEDIKKLDDAYVMHTYGRYNLAIDHGKGAICYDPAGKSYIDFTSGIGVNSLGFADEGWVAAVTAQLNKLQHISNLYYTEPCVLAAKLICEKSGMKKVFFGNSGAEANEGVIKAARKYSFQKYGEGRSKIVAGKLLPWQNHGGTFRNRTERISQLLLPLCGGLCVRKGK